MDVANNGLFDLSVGGEFAKSFGLPDIAAFQTRNNPPQFRFSTPQSATHTLFDETSSSLSAFFEGTWYLSDELTVIAGVRNVDKASKALSESSTVVRGAMVQKVPSLDAAGLELRKLDGMYLVFVQYLVLVLSYFL